MAIMNGWTAFRQDGTSEASASEKFSAISISEKSVPVGTENGTTGAFSGIFVPVGTENGTTGAFSPVFLFRGDAVEVDCDSKIEDVWKP